MNADKASTCCRSLHLLFPSLPAACVAAVGIAVELAFALTSRGHAALAGGWGSATAVGFLLWFWISVGWLTHAGALAVARLNEGRGRLVRWTIAAAAVGAAVALLLAYIASWGIFLQTQRFANWEAVRFTTTNTRMLWLHLADADPAQIVWLATFSGVLLLGVPLVGRWLVSSSFAAASEDRITVRRVALWFGVTLAVFTMFSIVRADLSVARSATRIDRLASCLNPAATMIASGLESLIAERIEPCLDESELTPIGRRVGQAAAYPAVNSVDPDRSTPPSTARSADQFNVIIVAVESLRADMIHLVHQGTEVLPNTNRLAEQGLHLTRAYSESTHSDYADLCLVSSLYPLRTRRHHFYRTDDPWPKTLLYDVLKARGYSTAIISSQNESWGNMDQFLVTPNLDVFYHPATSTAQTVVSDRDPGFVREHLAGALYAGKFPDRHTTDVALDWIEKQAAEDRPFCLAMNFQSSHFPYLIPNDAPRPFRPHELDREIKFTSYPKEKAPTVRNAYLNSIHECDRQIGRLVERLGELGQLERTILVVTGENGEAFNENGATGHATHPVQPVIHVAAVIHAPVLLEPRTEDYPFEHVDLVPTIAGLLGLPQHPNWQGIDMLSERRPPLNERLLFVHVNNPMTQADAVLLAGRWKFMVSHDHPEGLLWDVMADPTESNDLKADEPELTERLRAVLETWRKRQLAYYHFPMYYRHYYPPRPPRWRSQ